LITRKVCPKSLPGGSWERPCKGPLRSTGATPPLPRHAHESRPKTAPPAHRQERRGDPRPHGSGIEATGAAPRNCAAWGQGCRSTGRVAVPRPPPSRHQVAMPRPSQHRQRWVAPRPERQRPRQQPGASTGSMSGGPEATAAPAASPSATVGDLFSNARS
jgi:hypothetical protein